MDPGTGIPAELRSRAGSWRAAEDAIYPLAVTDTDAYEQAVELVGMLRAHFEAEATSFADLAAAADRAPAVLRSVAARAGMSTVGIDADAVVGCAAAARLRELLAADTSSLEERSIAAAQAAGLPWAVVAEPNLALAGTGVPLEWIEVHIASGVRLVRGISMDERTGDPRFSIEVMAPGESRPTLRLELDSRQVWLEEADEIRLSLNQ
jgi:hypothetical protein